MLYFEDYLELVEHLPQETVDRLTDMRELDLQVQNSLDMIDKRTNRFFLNAYQIQSEDMENEHNVILKEYKKILEDTEEKVQLTSTVADSLAKYMRRLDQDILKFKMELEADNCGITEIIERRLEESEDFLPLNPVLPAIQKNPRHQSSYHVSNENTNKLNISVSESKKQNIRSVEQKFQRLPLPVSSPAPSAVVFSVEKTGAGRSAIAAAASQAIATTQQMQQGRRTSSLKASYEAINTSSSNFNQTNDVSTLNREQAGTAQTVLAPAQHTHKRHRRRRRRRTPSNLDSKALLMIETIGSVDYVDESAPIEADPDEIRYCVCNEIAFGDMVACDNTDCPYEWYHYGCVGIIVAPEGKWYCPQCTVTMKRKNRKSINSVPLSSNSRLKI